MLSETRSAADAAGKSLRKIMTPAKTAFSFLKGFAQGAFGELKNRKIAQGVDGIGKSISGLAKKLIILQLLRKAFQTLVSGVKNAFSSYLAADKSLGASINNLKASLKTLYGSLASAFAPILETVVPYLSTLVSWLITGANAIAQFTAALMGKSVYKKASASIASTGSAADSAAKSVEKLNQKLGAYDELNVIDQDSGSGGGGGGASGGGGGDITYTDVDIAGGISEFADKVKEAWEKADFTEVGTIVGTKLKDALDSINWTGIKAVTEKMAKSIATFLNGFIATPGLFNSIGTTIAEALNTALLGAYTFLTTFDFERFGKAIVEGLEGFFKTFQWSSISKTVSAMFTGLLDFMTGVISEINWKQLPTNILNAIKDYFSGFDYKKMFESVGKLIGSAVAAAIDLIGAISAVIGDIGKKIKDYFVEKINAAGYDKDAGLLACGKAIIVGIFNGIVDFFKSIGTWIKTNIFDPFVKGFKEKFGISGSGNAGETSIVALGSSMILGIAQGIVDWFKNIGSWIQTNVLDKFKEGWNKALKTAGEIFSIGVSLVKAGWDSLTGWLGGLKDKAKATLEAGVKLVQEGWKGLSTWLSGLGDKAKATLEAGVSLIQSGWKSVTGWFNGLGATITSAGDAIKKGFSIVRSGWESVTGWFNGLGGKINGVGGTLKKGYSIVQSGWESVTGWFGKLGEKIIETGDPLKKGFSIIQSGWKTVTGWFSNLGKDNITTGDDLKKGVKLFKSGWETVKKWFSGMKADTISPGATIKKGVELIKYGWKKVKNWFNNLTDDTRNPGSPVQKGVELIKHGWKKVRNWFNNLTDDTRNPGETVKKGVELIKSGWRTVSAWFKGLGEHITEAKTTIEVGLKKAWDSLQSWFEGVSGGGTVTINTRLNSNDRKDAAGGGSYTGATWHDIPQYASGGSPNHGTRFFIAGEAGPEVVGHVGGRTEVLNKSQLAATMYAAVVNGSAAAIGAMMAHMTDCTNAVIRNLSYMLETLDYIASAPELAYAGISAGFVPDVTRIGAAGVAGGNINLDALADAVSRRISGNIQIENIMNMDGRVVYQDMVEIDRATIRQTGRSGFGR